MNKKYHLDGVEVPFGSKQLAYNHTLPWLDPDWSERPRAWIQKNDPHWQDEAKLKARGFVIIETEPVEPTLAEQRLKAAKAVHNRHDFLIAEAFEIVGLVRPSSEILAETTMRFAVLANMNGERTEEEETELALMKQFRTDWLNVVDKERNRILGLMQANKDLALADQPLIEIVEAWPEFTEDLQTLLKQIIGLQLAQAQN